MQKIRQALQLFAKPSLTISGGSLVIIVLSFILGWQLGHRDYDLTWQAYKPKISISNNRQPQNVDLDFKLFWDTWDLVSNKYIDKKAIDPHKLYYGAIQGMVAALGDPYTVFLPPDLQKVTREQLSGSFEGVGIQLGYNKDKRLVVIAPLKDTPADKAGVKPGDMILKINSSDAATFSLPDAVNKIRGPKGSSVALELLSESASKPREVTLVRDTIIVKTVAYEQKSTQMKTTKSGKAVAYMRISGFGEKTRQEWDMAVSDALSKAPQAVIVDVRNNPGGFLDAAVYIASEFISDGVVVMQEDAQGKRIEQPVLRAGKMLNLPLVVLINKGSASASEILAGAIQDHKRGTLVGEQSFGKGTIQSAEDLAEGTGIHITTAKWLTPNGRWIHGNGLIPDVKVAIESDDKNPPVEKEANDSQLQKAMEFLDNL